jgi:hypothetical protein
MTTLPLAPPPADAFDLYEAVFAHVQRRLDGAMLFARTTGAEVFWLDRRGLLRLWRVGHVQGLVGHLAIPGEKRYNGDIKTASRQEGTDGTTHPRTTAHADGRRTRTPGCVGAGY